MGRTDDAQFLPHTDGLLYHRTVEEIEEKVNEKGKRNLLSRLAHAKNDKETIMTWKLDLNGILHIFNVRSAGSISLSLTIPFPD